MDHLHVDGVLGNLRDEIRSPPLHGMRFEGGVRCRGRAVGLALLLGATADQRRVGRLAQHDLGIGHLAGQHPRDALERAAGAVAGDPVIELLALEVVDDLARGGARMNVGIGLVLELAGQEPAVALASSSALTTIPYPRPACGVSTTLAPRNRISRRRSTLNCSAMVTTSG